MVEATKLKSYLGYIRVVFITLLFMVSFCVKAQRDSILIENDSLRVTGETVFAKRSDKYISPHKATLYSAILPGMGQIYNRKYWKAPIAWIGLGIAGYALYYNQDKYLFYKSAYRDYVIQDPANTSYQPVIDRLLSTGSFTQEELMPGGDYSQWLENALNNQKLIFRKYRDYSYVAIGLIYIINIVDATVDAHFQQFDISDDLTLRWEPFVNPSLRYGPTYGVGFNLSFK